MRLSFVVVALGSGLIACSNGSAAVESDVSTPAGGGGALVTTCSGVLAAGAHQNVEVPAGASCSIRGVTVDGNVVARENARLVVESSNIKGNIQGEKAAEVHVSGGVIGGNIQVQGGSSPDGLGVSITNGTRMTDGGIQVTQMRTGRIVITDVILEKGNLQVEDNVLTGALEIRRNRIAQNLEVRKHASAAAKTVSDNVVGQKLECAENSAPLTATGNTARDDACQR